MLAAGSRPPPKSRREARNVNAGLSKTALASYNSDEYTINHHRSARKHGELSEFDGKTYRWHQVWKRYPSLKESLAYIRHTRSLMGHGAESIPLIGTTKFMFPLTNSSITQTRTV